MNEIGCSDLELGYTFPDSLHVPCAFCSRSVGEGGKLRIGSGADVRLDRVHARCAYPHQHLARAGRWLRYFNQLRIQNSVYHGLKH